MCIGNLETFPKGTCSFRVSLGLGLFDLILMDIMMPRMNSCEATRAIRAMKVRPDGRTIPIIAMTANAFAEDIQATLDAGMNAHLSKPIDTKLLMSTLQRCLHTGNK